MTRVTKESKIVQEDGVVLYVMSSGTRFPLAKLAMKAGFRIEALCNSIDISPRHLRRLFDNALGICPKKWLKSQRMVLARNLLRTSLSIKEISERLSFGGQKDFLREFREYYGVTPSDYRMQVAERSMDGGFKRTTQAAGLARVQ